MRFIVESILKLFSEAQEDAATSNRGNKSRTFAFIEDHRDRSLIYEIIPRAEIHKWI